VLGGLFLAMGVAWLSALALVAARAAGALRRPHVRAWIETVTGGVLVGLAVRLATERR
jgi:threonine/homoserine/homoserine lactone efflux protein